MNSATNGPSDLAANVGPPPLEELGEPAHALDLREPEPRPIRRREPEQAQDRDHVASRRPGRADGRVDRHVARLRPERAALRLHELQPPLAPVRELAEEPNQ